MNFTTLTSRKAVVDLMKTDGAELLKAKEEEKKSGVTNADTSKKSTQLYQKCRELIVADATIYAQEENRAVDLVTKIHANTKVIATNCEGSYDAMKKGYDEKNAKVIIDGVKTLRMLEKNAQDIKLGAVAHQDFRGNLTVESLSPLGPTMAQMLQKTFVDLREPPMTAYMGLGDKWTKIEEHRRRGEHYMNLLPALKKESPGEEGLKLLEAEAKQFEQWTVSGPQNSFDNIDSEINNVNGYLKTLKEHKSKPVSATYMATAKKSLMKHTMAAKAYKSTLKTAALLKDTFTKKAGPLAKDPKVQEWAKVVKTCYEKMAKLESAYAKKVPEFEKEYGIVEKALKSK